MVFFILPILGVFAAVIGGVVFAASYAFIRRPTAQANRFGAASSTRTVAGAIGRGVVRAFDFKGRANRKDFWSFAILMGGLAGLALPVMAVIGVWVSNTGVDVKLPLALTIGLVFLGLAGLASLACLSMAIRRLHDVNRSGWWVLLLGVFGYFILLYWFLQPATPSAEDAARAFT